MWPATLGNKVIQPVSFKAILDTFLKSTISDKVKKLKKSEGTVSIERVLQDMNKENLAILLDYGYTMTEIKGMVEDIIKESQT